MNTTGSQLLFYHKGEIGMSIKGLVTLQTCRDQYYNLSECEVHECDIYVCDTFMSDAVTESLIKFKLKINYTTSP